MDGEAALMKATVDASKAQSSEMEQLGPALILSSILVRYDFCSLIKGCLSLFRCGP